jgi:tetratricopeptide (TPR) repeat protein
MKKNNQKNTKLELNSTKIESVEESSSQLIDMLRKHWLPLIIIAVSCILVYSNTIQHDYASDDQMVIFDNKFVTAGTDSIGRILTTDAFEGFFGERGSQLISGGRYRPFSFLTFAIEWEMFGRNPTVSHIVNVLLFTLLCILIYLFLYWLFPPVKKEIDDFSSSIFNLPFIATLLYALHPIHTEVVANIKGRDEIFGFLFGMAALIAFFLSFRDKWQSYILIFIFYLCALLSKENAITFLAIFPLVAYVKSRSIFTIKFIKPYAVVFLATIVFLGLRAYSTKASLSAHTEEILNNPFVRASGTEKWGTILFSYLEYLKLLIFPWRLTHDYYFNQIPYRKLSDPFVFLALIGIIALVFWLAKNWKRKNEIVFSIVFFVITFSIVSNVFFTVGIIMNERFVFVSSLGFSIIMAWLLLNRIKRTLFLVMVLCPVLCFYAYKTYSRNFAWKDNDTLFGTDFYNSPNSAKVATSHGGSLLNKATELAKSDSILAKVYMDSSIKVLEHAINIYPENIQTWSLYGNAIFAKTLDVEKASAIYKNCLNINPKYFDALFNIGILNFNRNQLDTAEKYLSAALKVNQGHKETRASLGKIYAKTGRTQEAVNLTAGGASSLGDLAFEAKEGGNYQEAISLAQQALSQNANDAKANYVLGICYGKHLNKLQDGIPFLEKAVRLNDKNGNWIEDLAVAYGMSGQVQKTIPLLERVIELRPNEAAGYQNLATTYNLLGDKKKSGYYLELAKQKSRP